MFNAIKQCRLCGHTDLMLVYDLGNQYLSDFRDDDSKPPQAPLTLMMCEQCSLVQLAHTVEREALYHNNYGFRSGVNEGIVKDLKSIVRAGLETHKSGNWLDIASNDGTLLSFVPKSFMRIGFDPVAKFQPEASKSADLIHVDFFNAADCMGMKFDVVTSISMFYDIDDLNEFVSEVAQVLAPTGVWIIQQNYLYDMLRHGAIDNVCHEHLTYFSLGALQNLLASHGLYVSHASVSGVNGGVLRTEVRHWNNSGVGIQTSAVGRTLQKERKFGVDQPGTMIQFAEKSRRNLDKLIEVVDDSSNQPIDVYGASTRGAVLWQAAGIDETRVSFAVERQDEKVGKWFSPIGVQIISEEEMRAEPPKSLLIGPWWHRDAFIEREQAFLLNGGRMIFPLPAVEVVYA